MEQEAEDSQRLTGRRILVVDDEFLIGLELQAVFLDAGADDVCACTSLGEGMDAVHRERFDAAVLDVRLGGETSEDIARLLSARAIPFLFYSGQPLSGSMGYAFGNAVNVAKPAPEAMLVAAVGRLLDGQGGEGGA